MDEFKDIDLELMKLKEELSTKDEMLKQVKFPASGDYWRSRLDEERKIWENRSALGAEERKTLEQKLKEQEELIARYGRSLAEMEKKIESETRLWEDKLRVKEADILIEKSRLHAEARVREIEIDKQKLTERVSELSQKINDLKEAQAAELEIQKGLAKIETGAYAEKLKLMAEDSESLKNKITEMENNFKSRITELESLKEDYRGRLEEAEKRTRQEHDARMSSETAAAKALEKNEEEKEQLKADMGTAVRKYGGHLSKDIGLMKGFAKFVLDYNVDKRSFAVLEGVANRACMETDGLEKELKLRFEDNDDFKAAFVMNDEEAACWGAAVYGTRVKTQKITEAMELIKEIEAQKPCVCAVSSKNLAAAFSIRKKWPFLPVVIYGDTDPGRLKKIKQAGFFQVSAYGTTDDMLRVLLTAAKNSIACPEYWNAIKVKKTGPLITAAAAGFLMLCAVLVYLSVPNLHGKTGKVFSYGVPYSQPSNITFDGEYLWGCDWYGQSVYRHDPGAGLKLLRIFCFPGKHFTALAWANGNLWTADAWDDKIYKHNTDDSFSVLETYSTPGTSISGLAFDGANFWSCDSASGMIFKHAMDRDLTVLGAYESPGKNPSGLYYDGNSLWSVDSKLNKIFRHKMDDRLSVTAEYIPPLYDQKNYNLSGIAAKNGRLWVCSEKLGKVFSFPESKMERVR